MTEFLLISKVLLAGQNDWIEFTELFLIWQNNLCKTLDPDQVWHFVGLMLWIQTIWKMILSNTVLVLQGVLSNGAFTNVNMLNYITVCF